MKKLAALVLAVALLVCSALSLAEGIDLAGLTDEELLSLIHTAQEEMVARHLEGTATLMGGKYLVGKDIPAGSYTYTCLATGNDWGNMTIYSDKGEGDQLLWHIVSAPKEGEEPESFFITLNPDDQLRSDVPFSLTIFAGLRFE